ncbi:MAG: hypothetical protein O2794_04545 [bacterium]|nr:hypothetical protein [bacterium]
MHPEFVPTKELASLNLSYILSCVNYYFSTLARAAVYTRNCTDSISELDDDLDFAVKARLEFENGGLAKRREIITRLGSNFTLYDNLLDLVVREPLERVQEISSLVNEAAEQFEPLNNADNSAQFKLYMSTNIEMGA